MVVQLCGSYVLFEIKKKYLKNMEAQMVYLKVLQGWNALLIYTVRLPENLSKGGGSTIFPK